MADLLVFDGDCGFCTTSARWIEERLPDDTRVQPWQMLDLDELGLTEDDVSTAAYWVDDDGTHRGHLAVARALQGAGGIWGPIGSVIGLRVLAPVMGPGYRLVAKYRYRLPGATDACRLPS